MRTDEERLVLLHKRAETLRQQKTKRAMVLWGSASGGLTVLLVVLAMQFAGAAHGVGNGGLSASSMLSESAGGYVLVGVIAFAAGVLLTTLISRKRSNAQHMRDHGKE